MTTTLRQDIIGDATRMSAPTALTGPILVACDGTAGADAALRAAKMLAGRSGAAVHVVAVLDPMPVVAPEMGAVPWTGELEASRRASLLRAVRERLAIEGDSSWHLELGTGDPAVILAQYAAERRAQMVVLGIGHHAVVDRLLGGELVLRVMRLSRVPVLAVPEGFATLPSRVLVAMDFSPQSVRAAQVAADLFPSMETMTLVHVTPRSAVEQALTGFAESYSREVDRALERTRDHLGRRVNAVTMTLSGDPARTLLGLAEVSQTELIAMGTQGLGFVHRLLAGSVATRVVRGAKCAVLVVPRRAAVGLPEKIGAGWTVETGQDPAWWTTRLQAFTVANTGRRARLEIDDPELGAQAMLEDYLFRGVAYDPKDARIEFMFASGRDDSAHVTHSVGAVTSVDVLRDAQGRDHTLRVTRGDAQTLLTLVH